MMVSKVVVDLDERVGRGGTAAWRTVLKRVGPADPAPGSGEHFIHERDFAANLRQVRQRARLIALGTGEGLLFVRPVEEAGIAETSTASAADRCAATELTGYSRARAIERRGDPIK